LAANKELPFLLATVMSSVHTKE